MQRNILIIICALIPWFAYSYWFGSNGKLVNYQLQNDIVKEQQIVQNSMIRNNNLVSKVSYVKGSAATYEANARYNLNLIKNGEKVLLFPDSKVFIKNDKK